MLKIRLECEVPDDFVESVLGYASGVQSISFIDDKGTEFTVQPKEPYRARLFVCEPDKLPPPPESTSEICPHCNRVEDTPYGHELCMDRAAGLVP